MDREPSIGTGYERWWRVSLQRRTQLPDALVKFLFELLAIGGGSVAVACLLFQYLGKTWIENKFAQKLDELRHQHALEIQRLRVEIDSMPSGAIKLQDRGTTLQGDRSRHPVAIAIACE